jgi:hypothetical protein
MPRRVVEALLGQVWGIDISLGSTQKCWEEANKAVAAPCRKLEQHLKDELALNSDETGWRTNAAKLFLVGLVAARYVVYTVAATRCSAVLTRLLGAVFQGILRSDRFSAYRKYHSGNAQFCWAHFKRHLLGDCGIHQEQRGGAILSDALAQQARLLRLRHKFRSGQIGRNRLLLRSLPIQKKILALAERHLDSPHRGVRNVATALFEHNHRPLYFSGTRRR